LFYSYKFSIFTPFNLAFALFSFVKTIVFKPSQTVSDVFLSAIVGKTAVLRRRQHINLVANLDNNFVKQFLVLASAYFLVVVICFSICPLCFSVYTQPFVCPFSKGFGFSQ